MNRLPQLQATLPKNIDLLKDYNGQVELLLVNFIKDEEGLQNTRVDFKLRKAQKPQIPR